VSRPGRGGGGVKKRVGECWLLEPLRDVFLNHKKKVHGECSSSVETIKGGKMERKAIPVAIRGLSEHVKKDGF